MTVYLKAVNAFSDTHEAITTFQNHKDGMVALRCFRDGTATLYHLADDPPVEGQPPFDFSGCLVNIVRG